MKNQLKKLFIGVAILTSALFLFTQESHAGFETFQLTDRQDLGWGLVLGHGTGSQFFNFNDNVTMTVNTTPIRGEFKQPVKSAVFGGTLTHASGQKFDFETTMFQIRETTPGSFPGDVPYDGMFDDMEGNSGLSLTWDYFELTMTPKPTVSSLGYTGPLTWISKPNAQGNASLFNWERFGVEDLFGMSAWLRAVDKDGNVIAGTSGDFHFHADRQTNAVPEPATMALMAAGLSGMGVIRRRKKV